MNEATPHNSEIPIDNRRTVLERSLSAGHWSLLDVVMQKVLIFGAFFITARILTPADFGTIALAAIVPNLLDSLTGIAFDTALTQKKEGEEKPLLNVVWTFNFFRTIFVFLLVYFSAPIFAEFFHATAALLLFQLSALPIVFQGLTNIGQIYFFRKLEWKKVFLRDMANYATAAIVSVSAALLLHTYWALFIGNTAGVFVAGLSTYVLNGHRPKFDLKFHKLKSILSYSQWVFGQTLIVRFGQTLEDMLVGRLTDAASVGNYSKAKSLAYAPTSPLANIINKIGFSALVATGGSLPHAREGFYKSFDLAVSIAIPFIAVVAIFGKQLVFIILGPAWVGIIPLLKTLVVVSALNTSVLNLAGMTFNSLNKPEYHFRLNLINLVCAVIFLPTLITVKGVAGAALALLIGSVFVNSYALILLNKIITPSWKRLVESTGVTLISAIIPLFALLPFLEFWKSGVLNFFAGCGIYGILYILAVWILGQTNKGPYRTLFLITKSLVNRKSNSSS